LGKWLFEKLVSSFPIFQVKDLKALRDLLKVPKMMCDSQCLQTGYLKIGEAHDSKAESFIYFPILLSGGWWSGSRCRP
jgi:hypothetical protein